MAGETDQSEDREEEKKFMEVVKEVSHSNSEEESKLMNLQNNVSEVKTFSRIVKRRIHLPKTPVKTEDESSEVRQKKIHLEQQIEASQLPRKSWKEKQLQKTLHNYF